MLSLIKNILCIVIVLITPAIMAQEPPTVLRKITVSDGLPQGYISAMVQDSRGFVWIGTRNGLARYDGRKFRIFNYSPGKKDGLSPGIITHFWIDTKDCLWIVYEAGHADIFNTRTEKTIHLTDNKNFSFLKGTFKEGRSFVNDAAGQYWVLNDTGQVYVINAAFDKPEQFAQNNPILGIALCKNGIVLTTDKELIFLNLKREVTGRVAIPYAPPKLDPYTVAFRDNSAIVRKNGEFVIIDHERIIIYTPATKIFKEIPLPKGPSHYLGAASRVTDNEGNIYFDIGGYSKMRLDTANNVQAWGPVLNGTPMLVDQSGVLWTGTGGLGIEQVDLRINHLHNTEMKTGFHTDILKQAGVNDKRVQQLLDTISGYGWRWHYTKNETLWVAQSEAGSRTHHVFYLDKNKNTHYPEWKFMGGKPGLIPTCAMAEGPDGRLWGVGRDMRLYILNAATSTITFRYKVPFDIGDPFSNEINGLVADSDGFWISSTLGLFHYTIATGKTVRYFVDLGVLSLLNDPMQKDILWIGTMYGGLLKFNKRTKQFREFTMHNGLPNNTVYAILPDNNGNLWCSTNKGIFSFTLKNNRVRSHTVHGGFNLVEFNRYHYFKFPDGRLAFGGPPAYVIFDPGLILADHYKPETLITSIFINNEELITGKLSQGKAITDIDVLELPYNKNFLTFEFAAAEYNIPEKLQYRYRLKGLDNDWIFTGNSNVANYTSIPPGDYELYINATNTAGEWSDKIKKLKISIAPPFWLTWWFIAILVAALSLLIYFAIRRKVTQARHKDIRQLTFEREAMQLEARALRSQMNPHFIFNCLNSIKALIHGQQNKEAALYLTTFAQLLRNQLNNNLLEISLYDELHTCRLYLKLEALRFGEKLHYEFDIDSSVDSHNIKIPALLIQPFIENAIIHGLLPLPQGGKITVSVAKDGGSIICKIDDNGAGRNPKFKDPAHESKGVALVQGRLELYNKMHDQDAKIDIIDKMNENNQPGGTLIIITLNI